MARPVTLYTLQWGDLSLETVCQKAKEFGYDGVELGLPDHVDVRRTDTAYYQGIKDLLKKYDLRLYAISTHLVGQAVCDNIDERHKAILPDYIWGDGDPEGVHQRATEEMIRTAHAAKMLGVDTVVGFTGSSIWHYLYSFPPVTDAMIQRGMMISPVALRPSWMSFRNWVYVLRWRYILQRSRSIHFPHAGHWRR